ncbi:hypothetical protein B0O99DRAFT_589332 [Bisporella sp. PMI_857]|nr:hypothetical protein B0O99DRAFT_589332 [Bisporella sp. PMI_857]
MANSAQAEGSSLESQNMQITPGLVVKQPTADDEKRIQRFEAFVVEFKRLAQRLEAQRPYVGMQPDDKYDPKNDIHSEFLEGDVLNLLFHGRNMLKEIECYRSRAATLPDKCEIILRYQLCIQEICPQMHGYEQVYGVVHPENSSPMDDASPASGRCKPS